MNADIKECTDAKHTNAPHHHYLDNSDKHSKKEFCVGCGWGAPPYQRTPDVVEQVREFLTRAKTFGSEAHYNAALAAAIPDDWADHVAIVRKLTRAELWDVDVPEGHELIVIHNGGSANRIKDLREYHLDQFGFRGAYLLPLEVQA